MKKQALKTTSLILASILCVSCAQDGSMSKTGIGAAGGAVAGGLIGSAFGSGEGKLLAVGAGALLGGLAGGMIGNSLDQRDKELAEKSSQDALEKVPSGKKVQWKNPDSGNSGYITPTKTYKSESGKYCREYTHTINVGGKEEKGYGKACRQPDGSWQIISE